MSLFYKKISTKNAATIFAVAVMLMSGLYGITASLDNGGSLNTNLNTGGISGYSPPAQTSMLPIASYIPAVEKYHISQPTLLPQLNIGRDIHVTVFLKQPRQVALNDFLANLSNPRSSEYHKYLTMEQFDSQFGGNAAAYAQIVQYLQSQGVTHVRTSYDRLSVSFSASQQVVQCVFGVKMGLFSGNGHVFYMPESNPVLPATISGYISGVSGLSNYSRFLIHYAPLGQLRAISYAGGSKTASSGYLAPPTVNGVQFIYGSDMQVAYDEQGLFTQYGYPNGTVIATILWGGKYNGSAITTPYGSLTKGQYVGSFVPSNIYDYYNETLPSYEPHSHVYGVPLSGAPPPGHLAAFDSTGAVFENTLDLKIAKGKIVAYAGQCVIILLEAGIEQKSCQVISINGAPTIKETVTVPCMIDIIVSLDNGEEWVHACGKVVASSIQVPGCRGICLLLVLHIAQSVQRGIQETYLRLPGRIEDMINLSNDPCCEWRCNAGAPGVIEKTSGAGIARIVCVISTCNGYESVVGNGCYIWHSSSGTCYEGVCRGVELP